ncbi:MAG: energy transducer TonB [Gemmatimonadaceae bacterium]
MFELLQHPPRSPERLPLGAGVSVVVHSVLALSLFVGGGHRLLQAVSPASESVIEAAIRYLLPPDRPAPNPQHDMPRLGARQSGLPAPPRPDAWAARVPPLGTTAPTKEEGTTPLPLTVEAVAQNAFTLLDVDSAAARDPESAVPVYPPLLEARGVEGSAVVRFVVDSTGRALVETFRVIEATHPLFGQAVRDALPGMKFRPATMGTQHVRQLVEIPFGFKIIRRDEAVRRPYE